METITYEKAMELGKDYKIIPIAKEIYADIITPITLLRKIETKCNKFFLLESVEGSEKWARYSFLGLNPVMQITLKDGVCTVDDEGKITKTEVGHDAYKVLREILYEYKSCRIKGLPSFTGGFVGYFAYEMIGYAEPKLELKKNDCDDFNLYLFDDVICYDHFRQKIIVISNMKAKEGKFGYDKALKDIDAIIDMIKEDVELPVHTHTEPVEFVCNETKEEYCNIVTKTKKYIYEGDIFQGVLSRKFKAKYEGSLLDAYRYLRTTNPSPYMYFLQMDDMQIAGASPETLVKLEDGKLTTFPVAGSRPRGKTDEEDIALEKELLQDAKELSEHNMLVDLGRNDIGKISKFGTVKVKDYMSIHRFSKIMHIASTVEGEIRDEYDALDAISALLPAGTLSGAPKFRACQIINELEKEARGVYAGAIGYIDLNGNLDVCIGIRTAVKKGNEVVVQSGAGLVYDSVEETEYIETANKAGAIIEAITRAGEVM